MWQMEARQPPFNPGQNLKTLANKRGYVKDGPLDRQKIWVV
jgi:hypothetical protein